MLSENIRVLRKHKGFTQEELAVRLHVVRQTVSKWEKGLSVPDAETLQRMADILETDVRQLLGMEMNLEKEDHEVVEQLARINEQLVIRNKRGHRIWKIIGIVLLVTVLLYFFLAFIGFTSYSNSKTIHTSEVIEIEEEIQK